MTHDVNNAFNLLLDFLNEQNHARKILQEQYPTQEIDLYQDRLQELFANLKVLMYYQITSNRLDSLLKLNKAHPSFALLNEANLDLDSCAKIAENLQTLLYKYGQLNTFREGKPVDSKGDPIPWITYPALEFLSQFDYSECEIFEFGAGNSTYFWARRAKEVISVESDSGWYEWLNKKKPANVRLFHKSDANEFASVVLEFDRPFTVIAIDSMKHRYNAALNAINKVAPGGVIIFDNSDWYPNSCQLLRDAGFSQVDFHGFGPVNGYTWTTSVFFKDSFKLKRLVTEIHPIGGITTVLGDDKPFVV